MGDVRVKYLPGSRENAHVHHTCVLPVAISVETLKRLFSFCWVRCWGWKSPRHKVFFLWIGVFLGESFSPFEHPALEEQFPPCDLEPDHSCNLLPPDPLGFSSIQVFIRTCIKQWICKPVPLAPYFEYGLRTWGWCGRGPSLGFIPSTPSDYQFC